MNVTTLSQNVCRIEGVPRHLLGRLMVRVLNARELEDLWKLAPSEDETALELYGVDYAGREVVRRLWGELEAQEVLEHLPVSLRSSLGRGEHAPTVHSPGRGEDAPTGGIPCQSLV